MKLKTIFFLCSIYFCTSLLGKQSLDLPATGRNGVSTITSSDKSEITSNFYDLIVDDHSIRHVIAVVDSSPPPSYYTLNVSPSSLRFAAVDEDEQAVSVTSNTTWSAQSNADWILCSYSGIYGNGIISVGVKDNTTGSQRSGTITFSGAGAQDQTVSVTQEAAYLNVDPSSMNFSANNPDAQTVSVTSNTTWSATSNATWINCSYSGINGNGIISVGVTSNTSGSQRSGTITFSGVGVSNKTVSVTQEAVYLNVDPSSLNFTSDAGQQTIDVSSNTSWTVSADADWVAVSPASGTNNGTFTVTISENTTESQRTAIITVSGAGVPDQKVSVTQNFALYLYVDPSSLAFTSALGQQTVTVTSNTNWTVSKDESAAWLTISPLEWAEDGVIIVIASANLTGSQRTATITVSGEGVPDKTISVTQEAVAAYLYVDPTSLSFTFTGENKTFTIESNTNWTVSSNASWLTISPVSGVNNGSVQVLASPNLDPTQRTATITVSGSGVPDQTINVTQAGIIYLQIDPISLSFSAIGGQKEFTISSNISWTVSSSASWLSFSSLSGLGNANVMVTAKANPDTIKRTATIIVQGAGLNPLTINVTQAAAPYLSVSPESLNFAASGEQQTFLITSNTDWTIDSGDSWLYVTPTSGSNSGTVKVTATSNVNTANRTATITINGTGVAVQKISVIQDPFVPSTISVTGVSLSQTSATLYPISDINGDGIINDSDLTYDNSLQLTATVTPADATNQNVTWSSSDEAVVNVNSNGLITAISEGTATITVTTADGGFTATCVVTIVPPAPSTIAVTDVSLDITSVSLWVGETQQLTATVVPADATNQNVSWSSSDPAIATISNDGLITAIGKGTATITAMTEDGGYKATCSVEVQQQDVTVPDNTQTGSDGKGTIVLSLTIPSDVLFSGSFQLVLPNGVQLDLSVTHLVGDLATQLTLNIVQNADGNWTFTITPTGLRSATEMVYSQIMQIGYTVDKTVAVGTYDVSINDLSFTFDNGATITESEIPVQLTVSSQTGISDVTAKTNAYLYNERLYIDSPVAEKIEVFSEAGTLLYNFKKPAGNVSYPVETSKGSVLIVKGGSGWVRKVIEK